LFWWLEFANVCLMAGGVDEVEDVVIIQENVPFI